MNEKIAAVASDISGLEEDVYELGYMSSLASSVS
jgi:hypothetical protein